MTSRFKCSLEQDKLDKMYMRLYTNRQMVMDRIYGQISQNCYLSKAFKLKLGHSLKIFLLKIRKVTEKEIGEHVIRPTTVIAASCVKARCARLIPIIHTLWKVLKGVEERRERRIVGKKMILVLM